jgi:ActR/RegA family two-component response regulator
LAGNIFLGVKAMDELLKAMKQKIAEMRKIELTGFTNAETATAYFQE